MEPELQQTPPAGSVPAKADLSKRVIAMIIDGAIAGVLSTIPVAGGIIGGLYILLRDGFDFDFMKGRSVGKTLMKLRPVRLDGGVMDFGTSIKRNWMFALGLVISALALIPILGWMLIPFVAILSPIVVIIEAFLVYSDDQGRRFGDRLADTRVIETAD